MNRRADLLNRLIQLAEMEAEEAHLEADRLLIEWIDDPEIAQAYDAIHKWCA